MVCTRTVMEDEVECRSEASVEISESLSINVESTKVSSTTNAEAKSNNTPKTTTRKRFSSPCTPKVNEGFGDSNAAEVLVHVPQVKQVFDIVSKIGEGTFSNVYLAKMKYFPDEMFALKHIIPTSAPLRVENELRCLQDMGGSDNIVGLKTILRHQDHTVFVLPYFPHIKFQEYYHKMSVCEIREYIRNLFIALKKVHSFKIIHRDVKPSNFLYCRKLRKYCLVDFGLAMVTPGSITSSRAPDGKRKEASPATEQSTRRSVRLSSPSETNNKKRVKLTRAPSSTSNSTISTKQPGTKITKAPLHSRSLTARHTRSTINHSSSKDRSQQIKKPLSCIESHQPHQVLCPLRHVPLEVCTLCSARSGQNAPRAGTPGFRSPEVLVKHPQQTSAVDIWSTGVILLSILSGRYPFFRAYDDLGALSQILIVQGTNPTARVSHLLGKDFLCSPTNPPTDLKTLCQHLRRGPQTSDPSVDAPILCCSRCQNTQAERKHRKSGYDDKPCMFEHVSRTVGFCQNCVKTNSPGIDQSEHVQHCRNCGGINLKHLNGEACRCSCGHCCNVVPNSAYDLLRLCLDLDPSKRITAEEALQHPFLTGDISS